MARSEDEGAGARMEAALRHAAKLYVRRLRMEEADRRKWVELTAVLSRLGLAPAGQPGPTSSGLAPATKGEAEDALRLELKRLVRAARGAGPGYDINRHIAVRRALSQLLGQPDRRPDPVGDENRSGAEINRRFRGARARRPARVQ